jgi:hypothetical protein
LHRALAAQLRTPTEFAQGMLSPRFLANCLQLIVDTSNSNEDFRVYGVSGIS